VVRLHRPWPSSELVAVVKLPDGSEVEALRDSGWVLGKHEWKVMRV
jgi:hypothetical protein